MVLSRRPCLFPQGCPFDSKFGCASGGGRMPVTGVASNTALNRNGCVDDVAALVAFVAGPESYLIAGANLTVDGGTNA
jgi:3-oxoacyl-[acyl-carrier protein] reductase